MDRRVQCAIAGGGPAGLMLGVLLARAGVKVAVLEKHADFLRDFRGDTIHPSTMTVMDELGWLDEFLQLPHAKVTTLSGQFATERLQLADFSHLPVKAPYIAMMPQWDFLNFLASKGRGYPNFSLHMNAEATDLVFDAGKVVGLTASTREGWNVMTADLVVCADGRGSLLRDRAGLKPVDIGAPMDVLWFRLSRRPGDTDETQARFEAGRIFIMLNRGDYWQCAFVIPKGRNDEVRRRGLTAFKQNVGTLLPFDAARTAEIDSWNKVALLSVKVDRLQRWARAGLLCIGDAAHAMSPVGGVGVNLAIQDAVAAANLLAGPLREGKVSLRDLQRVQNRRSFPTRATQGMQVLVQNRVINTALSQDGPLKPPGLLRALLAVPWVRRIPARLIGLGLRPEHVASEIRAGRAAEC